MSNKPLVSVAMIAYNHRPFIREALEGVLAQRRSFPIEIVISDDCSPDGTADIIDEYQARHPDLFVRRDPPRNVGLHANLSRVWTGCRGKYIAMLDGDDWWHSPHKLSTQIAFMEANPDCSISGHRVRLLQMEGNQEVELPADSYPYPEKRTVRDLILTNCLATCSVVFRHGIVDAFPPWMLGLSMCDWPLNILHAMHGTVGFINEQHATYRLHRGGVWSNDHPIQRCDRVTHALRVMREHLPSLSRDAFDQAIYETGYYKAEAYGKCGQFSEAHQELLRVMREFPNVHEDDKEAMHWRFRDLSAHSRLVSLTRYRWLKLAYTANPRAFSPFRLFRSLGWRWFSSRNGK
jgi:glycosyltransferase involved in cell wall biosynthesis